MKMRTELAVVFLASMASAYDDGIKPCWDIRLNEDAFCHEPVQYSISTPVFYGQEARDAEAQRMYNILKDKW